MRLSITKPLNIKHKKVHMVSVNAGGNVPIVFGRNIKLNGVTHKDVATTLTKGFPKCVRDRAVDYDRKTSHETWDVDKWERYGSRDVERSIKHTTCLTTAIGAEEGLRHALIKLFT